MKQGTFFITRYAGQRVTIGGVPIQVAEIRGDKVRLGIPSGSVRVDWPSKDEDASDREAYYRAKEAKRGA